MKPLNASKMNEQDKIIDTVVAELEQLIENVKGAHIAAGQATSHQTMDSWRVERMANGAAWVGSAYTGVLDTGRRGGKVPYDFADIIQRWAEAKGLPEASDPQFAHAVMWKIRREGSKLFREGGRHDIIQDNITKAEQSIKEKVVAIVHSFIFNTTK